MQLLGLPPPPPSTNAKGDGSGAVFMTMHL